MQLLYLAMSVSMPEGCKGVKRKTLGGDLSRGSVTSGQMKQCGFMSQEEVWPPYCRELGKLQTVFLCDLLEFTVIHR